MRQYFINATKIGTYRIQPLKIKVRNTFKISHSVCFLLLGPRTYPFHGFNVKKSQFFSRYLLSLTGLPTTESS